MSRRLIVMRHAKSDWSQDGLRDFERPLNSRGHADAPAMGRCLHEAAYRFDYVLSSPAQRARETVLAVCRETGFSEAEIQWRSEIYLAGHTDLLRALGRVPPGAQTVLLVGHNPGLEDLVSHLAGRSQLRAFAHNGKLMPTAAVAVLTLPDDWTDLPPRGAKLELLIGPRSLENL